MWKLMSGAAVAVLLSGCAMDQMGLQPVSMAATPVAEPAVFAGDQEHYAAVPDEGKTIPAVPVDKVPPEYQRQTVAYETDQPTGTIIIDPSTKHLYLITAPHQAVRYGIAVGRAGFGWSGEADIVGRTTWPKWIPPHEMIDRRPELEKFRDVGQPGGLTNPLGARALYLKTNGVDYGYRIHGTPEWESIGHNASSGCIRMINQDVMDLYNRVPDGTHVVVLTDSGAFPTKLTVPPPVPAKKPKPVAAPVEPDAVDPVDTEDPVIEMPPPSGRI
ncbi:MAG: L,D-transpeptidase [bacterium]